MKDARKNVTTGFEPPLRSSHSVPVVGEDVGAQKQHPHRYKFLSVGWHVDDVGVRACDVTGVADR